MNIEQLNQAIDQFYNSDFQTQNVILKRFAAQYQDEWSQYLIDQVDSLLTLS